MSWNYRVMRQMPPASGDEPSYGIHEVFYDDDGAVNGWTEQECGAHGESLSEIVTDMARVAKALTRPILDFQTGEEVEPAAVLADDLEAKVFSEAEPSGHQ